MWSQLQKNPLSSRDAPTSTSKRGESPPSCSQEEALRPACPKEAAGGWVIGGGGSQPAGGLLHSSPRFSGFNTAGS